LAAIYSLKRTADSPAAVDCGAQLADEILVEGGVEQATTRGALGGCAFPFRGKRPERTATQ